MTERFQAIIDTYRRSFEAHGDSPAALLGAKGRQHLRFQALASLVLTQRIETLLDYGCGLAHLLPYLRALDWKGAYYGVDIVDAFIAHGKARNHDANASFQHIAPDQEITGKYDAVFASGVFNLKTHDSDDDSKTYALARIKQLFDVARQFVVCDFMTEYVDFKQTGAQHWRPAELEDFSVLHLSRRFIVRHDLMPYEFSFIVYVDATITRPDNVYVAPAIP